MEHQWKKDPKSVSEVGNKWRVFALSNLWKGPPQRKWRARDAFCGILGLVVVSYLI